MQRDDAEGEGWSTTLRAVTLVKGIMCAEQYRRGKLHHHVAIQTKLALNIAPQHASMSDWWLVLSDPVDVHVDCR